MSKIYGAIEAGGTKFVCAVSDENMNILKRVKIPTTVPEETMAEVFKFFDENPVCAMGIGSLDQSTSTRSLKHTATLRRRQSKAGQTTTSLAI